MKYLKSFESISLDTSLDLYKKRIELVEKIISEMKINPIEVYQEIYDMFLPHIDNGIELNDLELVTKFNNEILTIYYPSDKKPHPIYGFSSDNMIDKNIINGLEKNQKAYYTIVFGYNAINAGKNIQNVEYYDEIDWEAENMQHIYTLVKECAKEVWDRMNSLYSIKILSSEAFIPSVALTTNSNNSKSPTWIKSDPFGSNFLTTRITKINWILEINP
jgi:hypothetical protein